MPEMTLTEKTAPAQSSRTCSSANSASPSNQSSWPSNPPATKQPMVPSRTADFLKINPNGYVPAMVEDDFVLTEMPAILHYISGLAPDRELLGSNLKERIRVEEWMVWLSGTLHAAGFGAFWRPTRYVDVEDAEHVHPLIVEKGRKKILQCFGRIEERIEGTYAVRQHLTVVDFYLHCFWRWGRQIGLDMGLYPRYGAVARQVEQLESVRVVMEVEGQRLNFVQK
ncbi:hypothetical protein LTR37_007847 [Vermiconidia calcicola]|uniref:Uncharacterized protein n=1 Tax=Vermiconidia calcicola TaxID=1690605 RepID=A0ACC3NDD4_9PEZI|nr:hypothetical protein LTR37_007847 [Vermiconidia calcicola]